MADRLKPAAFGHPIFAPVRPWLERIGGSWPEPGLLNEFAAQRDLANARGLPLRFVAPAALQPENYEMRVYGSGVVATRTANPHDLLNALAWLAFPRTKAAINALHALDLSHAPAQRGLNRSRLRDALTLFDEGGALVAVSDPSLETLAREHRWTELFWTRREALLAGMRFAVLGHAVLEHALAPSPGITCRALFIPIEQHQMREPERTLIERLDAAAARWFGRFAGTSAAAGMTPELLPPLPVFGYPGWLEESASADFYADRRYFRPLRAGSRNAA